MSDDITTINEARENKIATTNTELMKYLADKGIDISDFYANSISIENLSSEAIEEGYSKSLGIIYDKKGREIGGITVRKYNGIKRTSDINLSTHKSFRGLQLTMNHEFIHSWQFARIAPFMSDKEFDLYSEYSASTYTKQYYSGHRVPTYNGPLSPYFWPKYDPAVLYWKINQNIGLLAMAGDKKSDKIIRKSLPKRFPADQR